MCYGEGGSYTDVLHDDLNVMMANCSHPLLSQLFIPTEAPGKKEEAPAADEDDGGGQASAAAGAGLGER